MYRSVGTLFQNMSVVASGVSSVCVFPVNCILSVFFCYLLLSLAVVVLL